MKELVDELNASVQRIDDKVSKLSTPLDINEAANVVIEAARSILIVSEITKQTREIQSVFFPSNGINKLT